MSKGSVLTLEEKADFQRLIHERKLLLVQFGSAACAPCRAIKGRLEEWAERADVTVLYLPMEDFQDLAAQEQIFTVPTILVYVEGRLTIRESGCFSLEEILGKIERYRQLMG